MYQVDDTLTLKFDDTLTLKADDTSTLKVDDTSTLKVDDTSTLRVDDTSTLKVDDISTLKVDDTSTLKVDDTLPNLHFNEDGAKRQESSQQHDGPRLHEPLLLWDGLGHCVDPTRIVWLARDVLAQNTSNQV